MNRGSLTSQSGVLQFADPKKWKSHSYGLTSERWERLRGRSFWITGAGTGYGRSIAVALAAAGSLVILTGRRRNKLIETLDEMRSFQISTDDSHIIECDITDPRNVSDACFKVREITDSLYGLVNNAAVPTTGRVYPLQDDTLEDWERLLSTNVTAHWLVTKEIFPYMRRGKEVRILFMTSEAGWAFTPGFGPYNVTKSALNTLAASLAAEFAAGFPEIDVQVNTLVPGEAKTEMNQSSEESPYGIISMALMLLSHPKGGPNGHFFHKDGRHLAFAYSMPYSRSLI